MEPITASGTDIQLTGKSGDVYSGKIFSDKEGTTSLTGEAIVCLTNSHYSDDRWHHHMNSIFSTNQVVSAMDHFKIRDDISHLILIPKETQAFSGVDQVDDLIRKYLHG